MKLSSKILLGLGFAAAVPLFMLAPGRASRRQKAPFLGRNFAHRGLHTPDKAVPENSLEAFRLAAENGYGVELDVQLSKDGQVVVFHDDTLDRVCGVHGRVDDFDYSELSRMKLCGSKWGVPLFSDVLGVIAGRGPVICELKTGPHNAELCRKTYQLISSYRGDICIESFDPRIVAWFRFHAKDLVRGQLATLPANYPEDVTGGKPFAFLAGHTLLNFLGRPQFIAYEVGRQPLSVRLAQLLGAMKIAWTSHDVRNEAGKDAVIFEYYKPTILMK